MGVTVKIKFSDGNRRFRSTLKFEEHDAWERKIKTQSKG